MKLFNTLTKKVETFKPVDDKKIRIYSCGPTVYDHIHIGNLSSFIYADTLRRVLQASDHEVHHVMNFTDVDDKTIRRSQKRYPDLAPEEALQKLTTEYEQLFLADMEAIGNDVKALDFVKATEHIENMQTLIKQLYKDDFAYIADDGVYFSIEKYKQSGKQYGQLLELDSKNTSEARINNDEYDKESVHDFALWKLQKDNEPAWEFELDGHDLLGRPGWHIECSAMSVDKLSQPFDIHTGGVDLIFPHHENEIAQSTAGKSDDYAKFFVHNEHLLVDGRKMSKSLNNFYTLEDVKERGYDPLAFRLLVLQSHYRSQSNFTWENLEAAQNRLKKFERMADSFWQVKEQSNVESIKLSINLHEMKTVIENEFTNDLNSPLALAALDPIALFVEVEGITNENQDNFMEFLEWVDLILGFNLSKREDISPEQKKLMRERTEAKEEKDFSRSDELRMQLEEQGIGLRDTEHGQIWFRL